jgi:glycosyltransferase involved in cell wall biosynthesis
MAAARIARRHRAPLVLAVHDLLSARPNGSTGRALTVAGAAERRLLRAAAEVGVTSPEIGEHVYNLGVGAEHVHLLPHWAPDDATLLDRLVARRALGWPARPFTVVVSASGGQRPDLATVNATAELLHGEAQFVVLADRVRRNTVPAQPTGVGTVRQVVPLDDAAHQRALAAADLLLVAERPDTTGLPLPGTLAHYLAAGRAVLAAVPESGSVAGEVDRSAGAGLVVQPGNPRLLAAAIRALRADEPLRWAMSLAARRYTDQRLGRASTMHRLDVMMRTALGETVIDITTA